MTRHKILSPSILAADFCCLAKEIAETEKNGAEYLHFDVMDGMFVPSISFGAPVLQSIKKSTKLVMDVHLMVEEPIRYIENFVNAGADIITIHMEACQDLGETINEIKKYGVKCGISIKPNTSVESLEAYLEAVDLVLIMSVEPGFGGQAFIPESLDKIKQLKAMIDKRNLDIDISVDGGIYESNVKEVLVAGANVIVAGSAVFGSNIAEQTSKFMGIFKEYECGNEQK